MNEDCAALLREILGEVKGMRGDLRDAKMKPPMVKMNANMIRAVRGLINAWEEGVFEVKENPDPVKEFSKVNISQTRR